MAEDQQRSRPLPFPTAPSPGDGDVASGSKPATAPGVAEPTAKSEKKDALTRAPRPAEPPQARQEESGPPKVQLAPSVTLPKGGGALRSIGETFQPSPFTGTGTLSIPVPTSPGRQGFGPKLSLSYSSGGGNGPWGLGWGLSVPSVTRKTDKGLPLYVDGRESDVFILSGAEDLVPVVMSDTVWGEPTEWGEEEWGAGDSASAKLTLSKPGFRVHRYRPRTEGLFARIEQWIDETNGEMHWRATTKDNVTSIYGLTAQARIVDPDRPERVFEWLLEESRDDRGNVIAYEYKQEDLDGVDVEAPEEYDRLAASATQAQRYLKRIFYGNRTPGVADDWLFEVVLDYGEHGTWDGPSGELEISPDEDQLWPVRDDVFSTFRSGFDIRTRRLCRRVLMFHAFEELSSPAAPVLVSSTDVTYDEGPAFTYLVGVTQRGYILNEATGRYVPSQIPTLDLEYARPEIQGEILTIDTSDLENLPVGVDGATYRLEDLDGEGLPGVLTEQGGQLWFKRGKGDGGFLPMLPVRRTPSSTSLQAGAQLLDLDGDGVKDLVTLTRPIAGYFERTSTEGWESFRAFETVPNVDMNERGLQLIDISGDGFPDILVDREDHFVWWRSRGRAGFEGPIHVPKPHDERRGATTLVYTDPRQSLLMTDMTGDGLPDIVRIRNGDIAYWPNLGHGRFGARVVMRSAPVFDAPDQFRPDRVRTGDIDGTGTTDLVYLGRGVTKVWFNLAGNAFGPETTLPVFPDVGALESVQIVDLKGTGTACLVWSTPRRDGRAGRLRYVDLMGPTKPHLLTASINNMGRETRVTYAPSTRFYIEDRDAGRPWVTRLPFPVHVLTRVETHDRVAKTKLVNHFRYHHGHYDGHEREFRGFAMVEQWDTESFEEFGSSAMFTFDDVEAIEEDLHQPPVYTKTWFHTGVWIGGGRISQLLVDEYWAGDEAAVTLPDTVLPPGASAHDQREACRALRGSVLRQEVYALDGTPAEGTPYTVAERNFTVRVVQPKRRLRNAIVFAHDRETLTYNYERNAEDPRIGHALVLEVDAYGNPTKTAQIAYPRRGTPPEPEQEVRSVVCSLADFAALDDDASDDYRGGVPNQARSWELTGIADSTVPLAFATVRDDFESATEIAFEEEPTSGLQKRLLSATRTYFYEDDLSAPAALGTAGLRALVYERRAAAFSADLVDEVYNSDSPALTEVDTDLLELEGGYVLEDDLWWTRSGTPVYDDEHFFLATQGIDPWGNTHATTYDAHDFLPLSVVDPLGNTVEVANDYRVLAPQQITDPNGNRAAVAFDGLGVAVKTAVMGKVGGDEGDTLDDPTTQLDYDLFAYLTEDKPNWLHEQAREQHGEANPRWAESYQYFDGMGRVAMVKVQAEPGLAPIRDENGELVLAGSPPAPVLGYTSPDVRWVGTGRTVFDNKGNAVKQYEPYFSSTHAFESEAELVQQGVAPVMHYDALGRLVRVDLPNGTFSRTVLEAWSVTSFDPNDTVLESAWYDERIDYSGSDPDIVEEERAAELTAAHADTPTTALLDPQGRAFLTLEHAGFESPAIAISYRTRLVLDVQGNVLSVIDPNENIAEERRFGMVGQVLESTSVDAGMRRTLPDVTGAALRAWNSRGFRSRAVYDGLRRPTHHFVEPEGEAELLVTRTVWGEAISDPEDANLRTHVFRVYDGAGALTNEAYDFKGNLLRQSRTLALIYDTTVDWGLLEETSPLSVENMEVLAADLLEADIFTFELTYDALNRVATRTTPDASVTSYTYNEAGLLESVQANLRGAISPTTFVSDFDYNARGQRERCEHGNGTVTTYGYDESTFRLTRLRLQRLSDSAVLQDLRYTYDPVGNVVAIRDGAQQTVYFDNSVVSPDQRYAYDPLYRLLHAEGREHTSLTQSTNTDITYGPQPHPDDPAALRTYDEDYFWDPVGNLLELQHTAAGGNFTRRYVYANDGNRLLSNSAPGESTPPFSHSYSYDAHGNMTAMPHLAAIDWDHADHMQHADLGGGGDVWFVYDATGARVRKVQVNLSGSTRKERIYLGPWELYRERQGSPDTIEEERETLHIADDTGRLCLVETHTVDEGSEVGSPTPMQRYQYGNHLDSAALELDESAAIISYEEHHPFGTTSYAANDSAIEVSAKRYRYIGKERDEETGLYRCGARYLAAWLGRWTAADPVGLGDGVNRYVYARGNPATLVDPSGTIGTLPVLQQPTIARVALAKEIGYRQGLLHGTTDPVEQGRLLSEIAALQAQQNELNSSRVEPKKPARQRAQGRSPSDPNYGVEHVEPPVGATRKSHEASFEFIDAALEGRAGDAAVALGKAWGLWGFGLVEDTAVSVADVPSEVRVAQEGFSRSGEPGDEGIEHFSAGLGATSRAVLTVALLGAALRGAGLGGARPRSSLKADADPDSIPVEPTAGVPPTGGHGSGGRKIPTPTVKGAGKVADVVPESVPKNWSPEDIESALSDYERSLGLRKAELREFDEARGGGHVWTRKAHTERIAEEERFVRQLRKKMEDL